MVRKTYICSRCKHVFNQKGHYTDHLNRKIPCVEIDTQVQSPPFRENNLQNSVESVENTKNDTNTNNTPIIIDEESNPIKKNGRFICKFCKKSFSRIDSYKRHVKSRCAGIISHLMEKLAEKDKQLALEKQLNKTLKNTTPVGNTTNNTQNNTYNIQAFIGNTFNNTNASTSTIKPIGYGHENVARLTSSAYTRIFNLGTKSVPEFVKTLHFNQQLPEYHNLYIANIKGEYAMVYDGEIWKIQSKDEMLSDVYTDSVSTLDEIYHKRIKDDPNLVVIRFEEFVSKYDEKLIANGIKEELKRLLYNYRHMAEAVRKQSGAPTIEAPQTAQITSQ